MHAFLSNSWFGHCDYAVKNGAGVTGAACTVHLGWLWTPLVLDLDDAGANSTMLDLRGIGETRTAFDFAVNGKKPLASGWIGPKAGLLAVDINHNGIIDDGAELFGEATRLGDSGTRAQDGYQALAQYDINHDGAIDAKDPIFQSLVVWVDPRQDGHGELKSLASLSITKLSVGSTPVTAETSRALLAHNAGAAQNHVVLASRYFGPERCGTQGCFSYDVKFAMEQGESMVHASPMSLQPVATCNESVATCPRD